MGVRTRKITARCLKFYTAGSSFFSWQLKFSHKTVAALSEQFWAPMATAEFISSLQAEFIRLCDIWGSLAKCLLSKFDHNCGGPPDPGPWTYRGPGSNSSPHDCC